MTTKEMPWMTLLATLYRIPEPGTGGHTVAKVLRDNKARGANRCQLQLLRNGVTVHSSWYDGEAEAQAAAVGFGYDTKDL